MLLWFIVLLLGVSVASSQNTSWYNPYESLTNLVSKKFLVDQNSDTLFIENRTLANDYFYIDGINKEDYNLNAAKGYLVWKNKPEQDSVHITYRKLAINFNQPYFHKELLAVDSNIAFPIYSLSGKTYQDFKGFVDFNALDYQGAYSRSLSLGNSQDVGMNSNFNLQLNGYIMDSIRIEAAITDNTIPFQPDGNTYQVQEFDKLYITFERRKQKLTAGDFNITTPNNSYFLQFNKRVQGLWLQSEQTIHKNISNKVSFNGSIAKGQFARNVFNALEGNQGPYKLRGNNGEQFFIILAGTERVFIDGILMERGEDRDYIINYNTGELKFMPRQLMNKDKRIQVEFEYQDRNYLNSLFHLNNTLNIGKKFELRLNAYSNQDAKNQPYIANFSTEQKQFLGSIGDNINEAFYKSMSIDTGNANSIKYRLTSINIDNTLYDSVFVYSNNKDSTLYNVNFSHVGDNKGNYIISNLNTNGRSYQWVAPINGIPQGQYEPVLLLITPKQHQIFSIGTTYNIDSNKNINAEWSTSNYDPNLYAQAATIPHWGQAMKLQYNAINTFGKPDSTNRKNWHWNNKINYEYVQASFRAIAPYRNIEFSRDWSLDTTQEKGNEHLATFESAIMYKELASVKYNFTYYTQTNLIQAYRNIVSVDGNYKNFKGNITFNKMHSESDLANTNYFRPKAFIEKKLPALLNLTLGASYELERNDIKNKFSNRFTGNAFQFDQWSVYMRNDDNEPIKVQLKYFTRKDYAIDSTLFYSDNSSQNIEAKLGLHQWENHQINITGGYRQLNVHNPKNTTLNNDNAVVGRVEYNGQLWKRLLTNTLMYELGTGQEQKREYAYLEVDAGMGMYMWIDYNGDGIQQANEFELAQYADQRKFVRTLMLTNEYVKVDYANLSYSLQLQPDQLWGRAKGWKGFVSRFSNQLSLQLSNRLVDGLGLKAYNVFYANVNKDYIIQQQQNIINTLFFNRSSSKFGMEYIRTQNAGKTLLTYGLESNKNNQNIGRIRWGINKSYTTILKGIYGQKSYESGLNDGRTFNIDILGMEPSITAMYQSRWRFTLSYNYEQRKNEVIFGGEQAIINAANFDTRLSLKQSGVIQAKFTYAAIKYSGLPNTSIAYTMLDALSKGTNFLWNLGWDTKLSKSIELSLTYDGRKPGNNPIIHTGRMSIRALL